MKNHPLGGWMIIVKYNYLCGNFMNSIIIFIMQIADNVLK
jgi:hypothetical protein